MLDEHFYGQKIWLKFIILCFRAFKVWALLCVAWRCALCECALVRGGGWERHVKWIYTCRWKGQTGWPAQTGRQLVWPKTARKKHTKVISCSTKSHQKDRDRREKAVVLPDKDSWWIRWHHPPSSPADLMSQTHHSRDLEAAFPSLNVPVTHTQFPLPEEISPTSPATVYFPFPYVEDVMVQVCAGHMEVTAVWVWPQLPPALRAALWTP